MITYTAEVVGKIENWSSDIAIPDALSLKEAVDVIDLYQDPEEEWAHQITIAVQKRFDLRTGNAVED